MMAHSIAYRRILTIMGYYNYQNGLIFRHLNQEGGWDDHLRQSRELPQCQYSEEWIWNFDTHGDDYYNKRSKFKVLGLII